MSRSKDEIRKERRQVLEKMLDLQRELAAMLAEEEKDLPAPEQPASVVTAVQHNPIVSQPKLPVGKAIESVLKIAPDGLTIDEIVSRAESRVDTESTNIPNLIRSRVQGFMSAGKVKSNRRMRPARYFWIDSGT